jgi:LmbE family N-acetylglucosaminyl deacetylase
MAEYKYYDLDKKVASQSIEIIFPEWNFGSERVGIFSPHDDDALLGTGYLIRSILETGGEVFIAILCSGNAGYSRVEDKDTIVEVRKKEAYEAYKKLGVLEDHIERFEYDDFSAIQNLGWKLNNEKWGSFYKDLNFLRKNKITRVMVPNGYKEHIDHTAGFLMSSYDSSQANDKVAVDFGESTDIKNVIQYSVWADFSPEDALVKGRDKSIRANKAIEVPEDVEDLIMDCVRAFKSQGIIIDGLVKDRLERRTRNGRIELYLDKDPRPKLKMEPYTGLINEIDGKGR